MRDSKRVMGVLVFLAALPAWASDMCELAAIVLLPPVYLLVIVTCLLGLFVRRPNTARVSGWLLILCAVPALGAGIFSLNGSFHDSDLKHLEMFGASVLAVAALFASYTWAAWRLIAASREPQDTPAGSHPV
jgi:uncharacterized membrane protein YhaH (DUF805 family)